MRAMLGTLLCIASVVVGFGLSQAEKAQPRSQAVLKKMNQTLSTLRHYRVVVLQWKRSGEEAKTLALRSSIKVSRPRLMRKETHVMHKRKSISRVLKVFGPRRYWLDMWASGRLFARMQARRKGLALAGMPLYTGIPDQDPCFLYGRELVGTFARLPELYRFGDVRKGVIGKRPVLVLPGKARRKVYMRSLQYMFPQKGRGALHALVSTRLHVSLAIDKERMLPIKMIFRSAAKAMSERSETTCEFKGLSVAKPFAKGTFARPVQRKMPFKDVTKFLLMRKHTNERLRQKMKKARE